MLMLATTVTRGPGPYPSVGSGAQADQQAVQCGQVVFTEPKVLCESIPCDGEWVRLFLFVQFAIGAVFGRIRHGVPTVSIGDDLEEHRAVSGACEVGSSGDAVGSLQQR